MYIHTMMTKLMRYVRHKPQEPPKPYLWPPISVSSGEVVQILGNNNRNPYERTT